MKQPAVSAHERRRQSSPSSWILSSPIICACWPTSAALRRTRCVLIERELHGFAAYIAEHYGKDQERGEHRAHAHSRLPGHAL